MRARQVTQPTEVVDRLRDLGQELGYEIVVERGPMHMASCFIWEIATASINSRFPAERQAEELVYIMALLFERSERRDDLQLTFCQEAQVVDLVAEGLCSDLGLRSVRRTSLEIAGVWEGADPATLDEAEDLVARVGARIAEHVISRP